MLGVIIMINKECVNCKANQEPDRDGFGRLRPKLRIPRRDPTGKVILDDNGRTTYEGD